MYHPLCFLDIAIIKSIYLNPPLLVLLRMLLKMHVVKNAIHGIISGLALFAKNNPFATNV
jgi:hypothetical protein